jgi:hypothetical protein
LAIEVEDLHHLLIMLIDEMTERSADNRRYSIIALIADNMDQTLTRRGSVDAYVKSSALPFRTSRQVALFATAKHVELIVGGAQGPANGRLGCNF